MGKILEKGRYWDKPWNPVIGCERISVGCQHCWALSYLSRFKDVLGDSYTSVLMAYGKNGQDDWNRQVRLIESKLDVPLRKTKPTIFSVCWLGDLFQQNTLFAWIDKVFDVMDKSPQHRFLVLTKRASYMSRYLMVRYGTKPVPDHIWVGTSVESQNYIGRVNDLMTINANLWLSLEPLVGEVNISEYLESGHIKCVVVGGESNSHTRPMNYAWVSELYYDCKNNNVPFFFKSWGKVVPPGAVKHRFNGQENSELPWML